MGEGWPSHSDISNPDPWDQTLKGFVDIYGKGNGGGSGSYELGLRGHSDKEEPKPVWGYRVIESKGTALLSARHALFEGKSRIDWDLWPDEYQSISSILGWIQTMEYVLGEYGFRKFLCCGKRGAVFTNANYCPDSEQNTQQPVFDWITLDDLQQTRDKIIQESVVSYDPAVQVVIFVVQPLIMDSSVAMWRRTINVPNEVQFVFQNEIKLAIRNQEAQLYDLASAKSTEKTREDLNTPQEKSPFQQVLLAPLDVTSPFDFRPPVAQLIGPGIGMAKDTPDTWLGVPTSSRRLFVPTDDILYYGSGLYQNLSNLIHQEITAFPSRKPIDRIQNGLRVASEPLTPLNTLRALSHSQYHRTLLMEVCSDLGILDNPFVLLALQNDEGRISMLLHQILSVKGSDRRAVLKLQGKDAEDFMNFLQTTLDRNQSEDPTFWCSARRLLVKLSEVSGVIPTSLMIRGVTLLEKEAVFGGGFADIYRASYAGREVALKRMRIFQRGQERQKIHQTFCKEALLWRSLRHPHVLPFLGVDSNTFSPYLCMVSPWMQHGTIMRHLAENKDGDVNQLLKEVVQGLSYLHSQKIVHGDLRGGNILINDKGQVCLADFGLTVISEATLTTQTSNSHGSMRWMAPELHDPESFGLNHFLRTPASDIYAFGCVCFEVYTSRAPFADIANDSAVMLQVLRGVRPQRPPLDVNRPMSNDVWILIERCWKQMPSERLDIHKIIDITDKWK